MLGHRPGARRSRCRACGRGKLGRRGQHERHRLLALGIADAAFAAALEAGGQHDVDGGGARARERQLRLDVVVEHLDVAEALVAVRLALRQRRAAELDLAVDAERESIAVEVMARSDLPADRELVRLVEARVHRERLIDRQRLVARSRRDLRRRAGLRGRRREWIRHGRRGRRGARRQRDVRGPVLRDVAEPAIGAALQLELQRERLDASGPLVRNRDREFAAIDLLLAEVLVAVRGALRELGLAQRDAVGAAREAEARAIQVVTVEHREADVDLLRVGRGRVDEHLLRRQHVVVLRERDAGIEQAAEPEQRKERAGTGHTLRTPQPSATADCTQSR